MIRALRWLAVAAACRAAVAGANGICLSAASANTTEATGTFLFPDWIQAHVATFDLWLCDPAVCTFGATETIKGLTIMNYGTAGAADLAQVAWRIQCGVADTGLVPLTYAGVWGGAPVWTWAGTSVDLSPCAVTPNFSMPLRLYVDVGPCPAPNATVNLGIRVDPVANPALPGGITDQYLGLGCVAPFDDVQSLYPKTITYVAKAKDRDVAAPGDTVNYTIWYGRAGTAALSSITVLETLPPYSHWNGTAAPAPDPGWNPDPGPPLRLRWTFPGPLPVTGGPTGMITFQTTVDWGNGEAFEPGSGDIAAPEGLRLTDTAHVSYTGLAGCAANGFTSNAPSVVVRRYLFWTLGDQDVLFAGRPGLPDDEVIYTTTIRNVSTAKTWWNVSLWDTVPPELDVWTPGEGFDDPCAGWTITPSGCAAANPGRIAGAGRTILTWSLDLGPGQTLALSWKARVSPNATSGATAVNRLAVMELGRTGVAGGTGHAGAARTFVHLASIVLRTTYVSYVAWAGNNAGNCDMFITFYPLNKAADFQLQGLEYQSPAPFTATGGVSATIGTFLGTCLGGMGCAGSAGCRVERIPAFYPTWPLGACAINIAGNCPGKPFHFVYKLIANSPVVWNLYTAIRSSAQDAFAFTPSSSETFSGFIHYTYLRDAISLGGPANGDSLNVFNTSIGADGVYDPALATTALVFLWDPTTLSWQLQRLVDIDPDSQWAQGPVTQEAPAGHYRIVSSQARLVIMQSCNSWGGCGEPAANSGCNLSPTREHGTVVSQAAGDTFYIMPGTRQTEAQVLVGNVGAVPVTYRIEQYFPLDFTNKTPCVPTWMADTAGIWQLVRSWTVPAGQFAPGNPHVHGTAYDASVIFKTPTAEHGLWRVVQESPGAIEVISGDDVTNFYGGGSMLHASNGALVGTDFWVFSCEDVFGGGCPSVYAPDFFCPKTGMAVGAVATDGYSASYTTAGPDQCVTFLALTQQTTAVTRVTRVQLLGSGTPGNLVALYNYCQPNQKFFSAPFLLTGVHYDLIAPPSVFIGQTFWLTVVVTDTGGGTKTDYCGTTSFTSTDPAAKIEGTAMDTYNYTWDSNDPAAVCLGAGCANGCDNGVKLFLAVTLTKLGLQTLIAADINDGSITGLTTILVVGVDVKLTKLPVLAVAASGDTVQFRICWSNYSSASAFSFAITDAVPQGTTYVPDNASAMVCGTSQPVAVDVAYSVSTSAAPPASFTTTAGALPAGVRWLRWTVKPVGVNATGCACFRVSVN